jgi:CHAD domain-containing protein
VLTSTRDDSSREASSAGQSPQSSPLDALLATRLRKFLTQLPKVLSDEDAEAVHDLRVWSRRLQQVVVALFPKPRDPQAQAVVRTLRRARRAVGPWRDCDVLIEMVKRKLKRVRNPDEQRAWETVHTYLQARRERAISRARRRLANRRLFALAQILKGLCEPATPNTTGRAVHERPQPLMRAAIKQSFALWHDAFIRARKSLEPADVHAFRVQTKRLRYRLELARDLGADETKPALAWLRNLQDTLGRLHDRGELARMAAKALADPVFLLEQPRAASRLLAKLAAQRKAERVETEALLAQLESAPQLSLLEGLTERRLHKLETGQHAPIEPAGETETKLV